MLIYGMGKNERYYNWELTPPPEPNECPLCGAGGYHFMVEMRGIGRTIRLLDRVGIHSTIMELERTALELRELIGESG